MVIFAYIFNIIKYCNVDRKSFEASLGLAVCRIGRSFRNLPFSIVRIWRRAQYLSPIPAKGDEPI